MLPALAADANVIAMFRKEARTLTRLQHEALVQYRVLAQEPQLGVLYIVTEYLDGVNLADVLGTLKPTPDELKQLLAKLAAGLRVAHGLGAVHRDMSPDNVLLDGGKLGGAKIIDFGIAKDLDPSSKTIIGEGFAGKLNYVAPEQLGDFNREVGPVDRRLQPRAGHPGGGDGQERADGRLAGRRGRQAPLRPRSHRRSRGAAAGADQDAQAQSQGAAALDGRGAGRARPARDPVRAGRPGGGAAERGLRKAC